MHSAALGLPRAAAARLAVTLTVAAGLGVAGCGGGDGEGQPAGEVPRLEATEFQFDPAQVTVAPGEQRFEIVNRGEIEHALAIDTSSGEVETGLVGPGDSATLTADLSEAGTYEFYCPVGDHRQRGMEGSVTVQEDAGNGASQDSGGGGGGGGGY